MPRAPDRDALVRKIADLVDRHGVEIEAVAERYGIGAQSARLLLVAGRKLNGTTLEHNDGDALAAD